MDVKTVNIAKAREWFFRVLNGKSLEGNRFIITKRGKAVAAIVPIEDLEIIKQSEENNYVTEANRILSDPNSESIPWEEAKKELLA